MKINYQLLKDFLKPDWRKVVISFFMTGSYLGFISMITLSGRISVIGWWIVYLSGPFEFLESLSSGFVSFTEIRIVSIIFLTSYMFSCIILSRYPTLSLLGVFVILIAICVLPIPYLVVKQMTTPPRKILMTEAECKAHAASYCWNWGYYNYSEDRKPKGKSFIELYPACENMTFSHQISPEFCRRYCSETTCILP